MKSFINPLPNLQITDFSNAYDKINVAQKLKFVLRRVENIEEKQESEGSQQFLLFPQMFQKFSSSGSSKVWIMW